MEAARPNGALERLVGRGKAGKIWDDVVRRVAQVRGGQGDAMGRVARNGAESRCNKPLDSVVMLGIPQPCPGSDHVQCKQPTRVGGQLPKWMGKELSQSQLRRQLSKVAEHTVEVQTSLDTVWDASSERWS